MSETRRHVSRITSKGQATIPTAVRKQLGLNPGDRVVYEVEDDCVTVRKAQSGDDNFGRLQESTFGEWLTDADEEAYGSL